MPEHILYIEDLGLEFEEKTGTHVILNNLNLVQKKGEWLALIGQNGAGKTSLGLIIKGLLNPTRGKIRMFSECPKEDLIERKSKVGFLFSNPRDQICSLSVQGDIAFGLFHLGLSRKEIKIRVEEAMKAMDISHLAYHLTHNISGGEQQKVALAGLIAQRPDYMILDEPSTFLSQKERSELLCLLKNFHNCGMNILYISSTWEEISMADRVAVLNEGKISCIVSPNILLQKEEILKNAGHCLPDMYKLALELRRYGLDLIENVHDVKQMVNILTKIFREKKD